jgi:hypothetical protein
MSREEFDEDLTIMGMGSSDLSWWPQDVNPRLSMLNSPDLRFDSTVFGSSKASTLTDFNQDFSPKFNSANVSFDNTPSAFSFEQFSHPSSTFMSDFSSIVPNNNPSFSVPSMFAPAVNASPPPSQPLDASSFLQFQPTQIPTPVYPPTGALPANTSPTNASPQPTNTPLLDLPHSQLAGNPETSALSSVSGTSSISLDQADGHRSGRNLVSSNAISNASPQPTTTAAPVTSIASPQPTTTPAPSPQLLSPLSDLPLAGNPETSALSTVSDTSASDTSSSTDSRRSGRNPVPSKRHEKMNEIDGKGNKTTAGSAHIEKENIPPSTIPEWTIASHDYLLNSDLGKDWTACVQAWFELEQDLGYGSQAGAKVCLLILKLDIGFKFVL